MSLAYRHSLWQDSLGRAWTQTLQLKKGSEASVITRATGPRRRPRFASSLPLPAWLHG